jgi:hypothetical protein
MLLSALVVIASGCGGVSGCPTCGTTTGGNYIDIVNMPVPEHNPTGEPGGPFNSFDISWVDPVNHLFYVSDRIGLDIPVFDTLNNVALTSIQGFNSVAGAGFNFSPCDASIPPIVDVFGNFTRFGCRNAPFHLASGFGANGSFGGFPGAQCCASRANGVNPMSGPDGLLVTPDGNFLIAGNGSASVVVFDLRPMLPTLGTATPAPPTVIATIPTGVSADYDGPTGIAGCVASWNGEAGSAADCGDDRADEMAYDPVHQVLGVINGDPGLPFITFIDLSHVLNGTGTLAQRHCLPGVNATDNATPYGPAGPGFPSQGLSSAPLSPGAGTSFNPPSCIIGQIYYDNAGGIASGSPASSFGLNPGVPVDTVSGTFACPDPSNPQTFGGVSGSAATGITGIGVTPSGGAYTIPCHHAPILDQGNATFCNQASPGATCAGAIAPAGLGANAWFQTAAGNSLFLQANLNSIPNTKFGSIDVIDPRLGNANGPVAVASFVMPNCMPAGIVQGPGRNFLIGCGDHDGEAFPPNEYIIQLAPDGLSFTLLATITQVGGVDEVWYNPGDNKYYLAARDFPAGAVMGVIDAGTNTWLPSGTGPGNNVSTNSNSHSIAVDPGNNHAFVPMQSGAPCAPSQSSNGCVGVFAQQ